MKHSPTTKNDVIVPHDYYEGEKYRDHRAEVTKVDTTIPKYKKKHKKKTVKKNRIKEAQKPQYKIGDNAVIIVDAHSNRSYKLIKVTEISEGKWSWWRERYIYTGVIINVSNIEYLSEIGTHTEFTRCDYGNIDKEIPKEDIKWLK